LHPDKKGVIHDRQPAEKVAVGDEGFVGLDGNVLVDLEGVPQVVILQHFRNFEELVVQSRTRLAFDATLDLVRWKRRS
jgi:hypothetical protein